MEGQLFIKFRERLDNDKETRFLTQFKTQVRGNIKLDYNMFEDVVSNVQYY